MTDEYRLFIRDKGADAEQELFDLRNALRGTGIDELDMWAQRVESMRLTVAHLTRKLELMGQDEEE